MTADDATPFLAIELRFDHDEGSDEPLRIELYQPTRNAQYPDMFNCRATNLFSSRMGEFTGCSPLEALMRALEILRIGLNHKVQKPRRAPGQLWRVDPSAPTGYVKVGVDELLPPFAPMPPAALMQETPAAALPQTPSLTMTLFVARAATHTPLHIALYQPTPNPTRGGFDCTLAMDLEGDPIKAHTAHGVDALDALGHAFKAMRGALLRMDEPLCVQNSRVEPVSYSAFDLSIWFQRTPLLSYPPHPRDSRA